MILVWCLLCFSIFFFYFFLSSCVMQSVIQYWRFRSFRLAALMIYVLMVLNWSRLKAGRVRCRGGAGGTDTGHSEPFRKWQYCENYNTIVNSLGEWNGMAATAAVAVHRCKDRWLNSLAAIKMFACASIDKRLCDGGLFDPAPSHSWLRSLNDSTPWRHLAMIPLFTDSNENKINLHALNYGFDIDRFN